MSGETEAAGDVLTGAIVASTVEGAVSSAIEKGRGIETHGACRNCGCVLTGAFCASCGQPRHLHRSILSLGHDLLHGLLHLEGKIWRTLPELFFHPGRLTRRYIHGERAKFVSPMALYLFTVFLMFSVFSFTTSSFFEAAGAATEALSNWKQATAAGIEAKEKELARLQAQMAAAGIPAGVRSNLAAQITSLEQGIGELRSERAQIEALNDKDELQVDLKLHGRPSLERDLKQSLQEIAGNPSLALYKAKAASYKYSWALIPLSVPFVWLLFFWRRDFRLYDHAVFVTYSISFMMLFLAMLSLAAAFGLSSSVWGWALVIVPPFHIYKQLRYAYGLPRSGALLRLWLLTLEIGIVLGIFIPLLLLIGMLG